MNGHESRQVLLAVTALLTMAALLVSTPPASATDAGSTTTDSPPPVITSPVEGERVRGEIQVTVESTASTVLVNWRSAIDVARFDEPVATQDGVASTTLSTSGYHGVTEIVARECDADGVCEGPQAAVQVDVENPAPTFDPQRWQDVLYGDHHLFKLNDEGSWALYGFSLDGEFVPPIVADSFFPVTAGTLSDGDHTVQVAHCTQVSRETMVEPPDCDWANASEVRPFTIRTALHPKIIDVQPQVISPDGDGVNDSAAVTVDVESPHNLAWALVDGTNRVAGGTEVQDTAGPYTFTVDGLGANGEPAPDGRYALHVFTYVPDTDVHGETATELTLDNEMPTVTRRQPGTLRPGSNWTVTFSEPVLGVDGTTLRLYRPNRTEPVPATITGSNGGHTWTLDPAILLAGNQRYTLRLSPGIRDVAGNSIAADSYTRSFAIDLVRPRVVRRTPDTRTTRNANWVVRFSEPVRGVTRTTMRLYRAGRARPVAAELIRSNGGRTWTLNPSVAMARRVRYTLELSSAITDKAGNRLRAMSYSSTVR